MSKTFGGSGSLFLQGTTTRVSALWSPEDWPTRRAFLDLQVLRRVKGAMAMSPESWGRGEAAASGHGKRTALCYPGKECGRGREGSGLA